MPRNPYPIPAEVARAPAPLQVSGHEQQRTPGPTAAAKLVTIGTSEKFDSRSSNFSEECNTRTPTISTARWVRTCPRSNARLLEIATRNRVLEWLRAEILHLRRLEHIGRKPGGLGSKEGTAMPEVKMIVMYPQPADVEAFEKLYQEEHLPMAVEKLAGKTKLVATKVVSAPTGAPAFHRIAEVHFPSMDALNACAASQGGQETLAHAGAISTGGRQSCSSPRNKPIHSDPVRSSTPAVELTQGYELLSVLNAVT